MYPRMQYSAGFRFNILSFQSLIDLKFFLDIVRSGKVSDVVKRVDAILLFS